MQYFTIYVFVNHTLVKEYELYEASEADAYESAIQLAKDHGKNIADVVIRVCRKNAIVGVDPT